MMITKWYDKNSCGTKITVRAGDRKQEVYNWWPYNQGMNNITLILQGWRKLDLFGQAITSCMEHTCMQNMHILGGLGAFPPRKFWKTAPSRIISESIFNEL